MKKTIIKIITVILCLIIWIPGFLHAEDLEKTSAEVNLSLKIELPELAGIIPTLTFIKKIDATYYVGDHLIEVDSEDCPKLYYEVGPNPLYKNLTIEITMKDESTAIAKWTDDGPIIIDGLDLKVSAFNLKESQITDESIPILSGIFYDIYLTSGVIEEENYKLQGLIDSENLSTTLVFITDFPSTGMDVADTYLAGSLVLGELTLQVANPFEK